MPVKFPCTKCKKACKSKEIIVEGEESICCDECEKWVHFECTNLNGDELEEFSSSDKRFVCDRCLNTCQICHKLCRKNQKLIRCCSCKHAIHTKMSLPCLW